MKDARKRVCRCMVWVLFFVFIVTGDGGKCQAKEPDPEEIHALSAVLMDAVTGRVLYAKEGNVMRPMASTTKIMTCIIALEKGDFEKEVVVSSEAASQPAVHLQMKEGQRFRLQDLLYSLMLESHNDTAVAIAEHVGGSVEGFAELMNQKAEEIGCTQSYFITPNGLDAEDENGSHSISAEDLARIMSYCICVSLKAEEFLEITQTDSYSFTDIEGKSAYSCQNHNLFLSMMEGALTGKTGYTGGAGYCYVGALEKDGRIFVAALLGSGWPNQKNYKWQDMTKLMEYALADYHYKKAAVPSKLSDIPILKGKSKNVKIKADSEMPYMEFLVAESEEIHAKIEKNKQLEAPIEKDQIVGKITYLIDETEMKEIPIVTEESVEKRDYIWIAEIITEKFFCFDTTD